MSKKKTNVVLYIVGFVLSWQIELVGSCFYTQTIQKLLEFKDNLSV